MSSTAQLRPVQTARGDRYAVAAIVVQESPDGAGSAELTALATRLADEARRLLLEERPGANVTAAVAVSGAPAATIALDAPETCQAPAGGILGTPAGTLGGSPGGTVRNPTGGIEVDRSAYRASVDGRALGLSFREFELLAFLVEHPGRVFSRRQLVSSVWNGAEVGTRTVDVHVRRLRAKLGSAADRITTIRNVGYRFEPSTASLETVA